MVSARVRCMLCSLFLAAGTSGAAGPAQVVGVKLMDSSTDPSITHMRVALDHSTLKPGLVTFKMVNTSKTLTHEIIIVRDKGSGALPFDAKHDRVNEHAVRALGEVSNLAPGKTGELSLNLGPGRYLLLCNEPGHYKDGMVAALDIAP
jgi:uncharacterized cupredoxin-like copper-binding protein